MSKKEVITIIPDKQIIIDKSDLDFFYKQIADLEAKLAEKQEVRDFYLKRYEKKLKEYDKENKQLKQQLAEKEKAFNWLYEKYAKYVVKAEKEIEELKEVKEIIRSSPSMLVGLDINSPINKKAKTDFAIEQLKKAKEIIARHTLELWTCENDDIDIVLYEEIDQQIKELKHQHEDKEE